MNRRCSHAADDAYRHLTKVGAVGVFVHMFTPAFSVVDQPLAVTVSLDEAACERLMLALGQEEVDLAYVKVPVEFGRVGRNAEGA